MKTIKAICIVVALLCAPLEAAVDITLNAVGAASTAGTSIATDKYNCVQFQVKSATTSSTSVYVQQSLDNSTWTTVGTISNPSAASPELVTVGSAPFTRGYTGSDWASGTITAYISQGAGCNASVGYKTQAASPTTNPDVTDGFVFIPAWQACAATTPSATLAVVRAAAGNWNLARTAAGAETYSIGCSLGSFLQRTAASKGIKITGLKIVNQITVAALTSNAAPTLKLITYADNTAPAISNFGGTLTVTMPTATQTQPYVTTVGLGTPAFFNTDGSDLVLDLSAVVMANTGVFALQGILVNFTLTNP